MIRSKKSKRKPPRRARAKTHQTPNAEGSQALSGLPPYQSLIGLPWKSGPLGISPQDIENVRWKEKQLEQEIRKRQLRLRELEPRAMAEVRRLGIDEKRLVTLLWETWFASHKRIRKLSTVPGVSFRQVKRLPALMRKIAAQLQAINEHGYSLTASQMLMMMASAYLRGKYITRKRLPGHLRLCAHDLSMQLQHRRHPELEAGTEWKVQTVEFVRKTSNDGSQHYEVIAPLMNAFNKMEDEKEAGASKRVAPESLKRLWLAHPGLRKARLNSTLAAPGKLN